MLQQANVLKNEAVSSKMRFTSLPLALPAEQVTSTGILALAERCTALQDLSLHRLTKVQLL